MLTNYVEVATRKFTDRQKPRALFEESIKQLDQTKIISYYGIGGIGKTRLLAFLEKEAANFVEQPVCLHVDFNESYFRNIGEFLNSLKFKMLAQEKIDFYSFDLAYALYWSKTQPGEMRLEKSQTVVQEGHILFDIINNLEDVPYASLIPKAINLMSKIPSSTKKAIWWKSKGQMIVGALQGIEDIQTLRDILVELWVEDVTEHFKKSGRKLVFFFDSFENLDLTRLPRVKTITQKFKSYPVLFVIGSRNKLNWESTEEAIVDEHLVGELSPEDIRCFLQSCGIGCLNLACTCQKLPGDKNENMQNCQQNHEIIIEKIIKVTNGIPVYLDLMVDTYLQIKKSEIPRPEHFTDQRHEIFDLLLKHFTDDELAVLSLLAYPNFWNFKIAKRLLQEYGYTKYLAEINRFYDHSFIQNENMQHITMQSYIRKWLQDKAKQANNEYFYDVHVTLFHFYEQLFNIDAKAEHFSQAAYHAQLGLEHTEFEVWLLKALNILQNRGDVDAIIAYLHPSLTQYNFSKAFQSKLYAILLQCYFTLGQYEEINKLSVNAINIANMAYDNDNRKYIQYILGQAHYNISNYDEALKYLKLSIAGDNDTYQAIEAMMTIGKILITTGSFDAANNYYLQASKRIHQFLQQESQNTQLFQLAGQCYEKLGEVIGLKKLHTQQLQLYKQSLYYLQRATEDKDHPQYLQHLMLLGFSYKRLAEAYEFTGGNVIETYYQAIACYEKVLEQMPYYVDALEKLGHASADLMRVARTENRADIVLTALDKGQKAFTLAIEAVPNRGSSLNRLSSVNLEMANYYIEKLEFSKAKFYLDEAEKFYDLTKTRTPNYAYLASKRDRIEAVAASYYRAISSNK